MWINNDGNTFKNSSKFGKHVTKIVSFLGVGVRKIAFLSSNLDGFSQITHQNDGKKENYNIY